LSVPSHEPARTRDSSFTLAFSLIALATACAVVLVCMPRRVEPARLPPFVLDTTAVELALAREAELAAAAPANPGLTELYELFLAEGRAEIAGVNGLLGTAQRRARIAELNKKLLAPLSKPQLQGVRARDTARFISALLGELPDAEEASGLVGTFPDVLRRYGLLRADGSFSAPEISVRAMYKARWNLIHERDPSADFEAIDIQAYDGWNALSATALKPQRRAIAAKRFLEAGGRHGRECYAIWLYQGQGAINALSLLEQAYDQSSALRLRNQAFFIHTKLQL
jgi:hypothetical protein